MTLKSQDFPEVRGKLNFDVPLAPYTWFRVGGPADTFFIPSNEEDLSLLLSELSQEIPVSIIGAGSNMIVRDGGIEGVVVRLVGGYWGNIDLLPDYQLHVRAGAFDLSIAKQAAKLGVHGLSFLSGIPGTIGGAVRTNAGCYGRELKDILERVHGIARDGTPVTVERGEIQFSYRHTDFPPDIMITSLVLQGDGEGDSAILAEEIKEHQARRAETQPIREKTGGSTFANPDPPGTKKARSSWKLIDKAGCRGLRVGGAMVSEKHCNFLINTGEATAADIEALGELVRARVMDVTGVDLRWEIRRVGRL